jgi:hypothetical protein
MSARGAARSNTTTDGVRWRRILCRKPAAECRMASALNAPRGYSANSKKAHLRLVRSAESKKAQLVRGLHLSAAMPITCADGKASA